VDLFSNTIAVLASVLLIPWAMVRLAHYAPSA
jgi:hypothetical protein